MATKFVPLHLVGKLKDPSAANYALSANPQSAFNRYYGGDAAQKEFTINELLDTLNANEKDYSAESRAAYNNLTTYIWANYQDKLVAAFEDPSLFERCWAALVKVAAQGTLASHAFLRVSKSKLFAQQNFRNILKDELNGISLSDKDAHVVKTALKIDEKFVKNTLRWAHALNLDVGNERTSKNLSLEQLDKLSASTKILEGISSGAISEEGVVSYLKWADSSYRVFDRFLFAILGPSRFDQANLAYPPGESFREDVRKALKAKQAKPNSNQKETVATPDRKSDDQQPPREFKLSPAQMHDIAAKYSNKLNENVINHIKTAFGLIFEMVPKIKSLTVGNNSLKKYLNWMTHPPRIKFEAKPVLITEYKAGVQVKASAVNLVVTPKKEEVLLTQSPGTPSNLKEPSKSTSPGTPLDLGQPIPITAAPILDASANTQESAKLKSPGTPSNLKEPSKSTSPGTPLDLGQPIPATSMPVQDASADFQESAKLKSSGTPSNLKEPSKSTSPGTPLNLGQPIPATSVPVQDAPTNSKEYSWLPKHIKSSIKLATGETLEVRQYFETKQLEFVHPITKKLLYSGTFDVNTRKITVTRESDNASYTGTYRIKGTELDLNLKPVDPNLQVEVANKANPSISQKTHKEDYARVNARLNSVTSPKPNSGKSKSVRGNLSEKLDKENLPNMGNTKNQNVKISQNSSTQSSPIRAGKEQNFGNGSNDSPKPVVQL